MADRVLRGSRMGAVSYETDRDHDLAPRQMVKYRTEDGEIYEVPFADDAEIPEEWLCKMGNASRRRRCRIQAGKTTSYPLGHAV